jgi:chromosome segregation ATPase
MVFLEEAIIDPGCGFKSAIVGAVRYTSHHYQLETNTVANASKLLKLSPILYDGTIALVLKGENGRNNSGHPSSTTEDLPTTIGRTSSTLEMAKASDTMKSENGNLTKQVMKLLKENRDLKRINDVLEKAKNSSGRNNKPIELEVSSGEDMDLDDTDSSIEQGEEKTSCQTQGKEEKAKTMNRTSELEKIKQLEKDFAAVTNTCKVLERQTEEAEKEVNDDYERRLHEIHESWREQNTQIKEQKEELERLEEELKSSKDKLAQEETEKEQLDFRLQEKSKKYQEMTDALTRSTIVIQEEAAVRKSMALSIVGLRKAKKRAEKELKAHKSLYTKMKSEDNYDF